MQLSSPTVPTADTLERFGQRHQQIHFSYLYHLCLTQRTDDRPTKSEIFQPLDVHLRRGPDVAGRRGLKNPRRVPDGRGLGHRPLQDSHEFSEVVRPLSRDHRVEGGEVGGLPVRGARRIRLRGKWG